MYIDSKLDWHRHISYINNKLTSSIYAIRKIKNLLNLHNLLTLYYTLFYPYIDYGITLWGSTHKTVINKIVVKQKKAIRIISNAKYNENTNPLFFAHKILKTQDIYKLKLSKYIYMLARYL